MKDLEEFIKLSKTKKESKILELNINNINKDTWD